MCVKLGDTTSAPIAPKPVSSPARSLINRPILVNVRSGTDGRWRRSVRSLIRSLPAASASV